jgi:hypothetical protein
LYGKYNIILFENNKKKKLIKKYNTLKNAIKKYNTLLNDNKKIMLMIAARTTGAPAPVINE